jgi:uncharacterized protein (DUF58 family)
VAAAEVESPETVERAAGHVGMGGALASSWRWLRATIAQLIVIPTRRLAWVVMALSPVWLLAGMPGAPKRIAIGVIVLVALAVLWDAAVIPPRRRLTVERAAPPSVGVGDRIEFSYTLRLRWPWRMSGTLYDALPSGIRRETALPQSFVVATPGGECTVQSEIMGRERGEWPLGVVALRIYGPLALVARTYRYQLGDRILVVPSIANVRRYRLLALQHRLNEVGVRVLRRRGEGTNFAGLREYAIGDDPRRIDWKASARRQELISREYSIEQGQSVMIVIDCGRLMTQMAGELSRFEYALSSALVLADIAIGSGDQAGLLAFDDQVRSWVAPARGLPALRELRASLIPLRATMVEPDYATAFRTLDARQRKRSLIVFYTDVIDPRASQSLIAHTTRGTRHHLPVVVALRNEALVSAAVRRSDRTTMGVYERAAAEELLAGRYEALERMRQAGVSVIDVRPQAMTAAVVNRYLELKGRGAV